MTNSKSTKRALVSSTLAILMCMAMLIGTTFAWFTDTASTAVNKIQSGKLDVALEMFDKAENKWVSAENKTLDFVKAEGAESEEILWEPGATYKLPELRIVNNGNLALKYKVVISGIDGNAKLLEAIDFTVQKGEAEAEKLEGWDGVLLPDGANAAATDTIDIGITAAITISGHMKEDAGNEYQDKTIEGIGITDVATQYTYEYDSDKNTYDENATYLNTDAEGNVLISTAGELKYFALAVNKGTGEYSGKTVKLVKDIDLQGENWTPIVANNITFDGNDHTISNLYATGEKNVGFFGISTNCTIKKLTIDGAVVKGINHVAAIAGDALCAKIENCTVKNAEIVTEVKNDDDGDKAGAIAGYLSAEPIAYVKNCVVESSSIRGYRDIGALIGYANSAAEISGNSVNDTTVIGDQTNNYKNYTADAEFDINEIVGEYNGNTLNETNSATNVDIQLVKPANSQDELAEKIANDAKNLKLGNGVYTLYNVNKSKTQNATLTIEGNGADDTTFTVGKKVPDQAGEYNADYSYEGSDVTFKNMTVNMGTGNYKGIVRANSLYFENCTITGRGSYWGTGKVVFKNCVFEDNNGDYNMQPYSGSEFVFDTCVFKSASGKFINAYKEQRVDTKLDFINCTFEGTCVYSGRGAVCLKKYTELIWTVNFTDCTAPSGKLWWAESGMNAESSVTVNNTVVWKDGAAVN